MSELFYYSKRPYEYIASSKVLLKPRLLICVVENYPRADSKYNYIILNRYICLYKETVERKWRNYTLLLKCKSAVGLLQKQPKFSKSS